MSVKAMKRTRLRFGRALVLVGALLLPGAGRADPAQAVPPPKPPQSAQKKPNVNTSVNVTVVSDPTKAPPLPLGSVRTQPEAKPGPKQGDPPPPKREAPGQNEARGQNEPHGADALKHELREENRGERRAEHQENRVREREPGGQKERARERQSHPEKHR